MSEMIPFNDYLTVDTETIALIASANDLGAFYELIKKEYSYIKNKYYSPIFKLHLTAIYTSGASINLPALIGTQIDDGDIAYGDVYTGIELILDTRDIAKLILVNPSAAASILISIELHNWQPFIEDWRNNG